MWAGCASRADVLRAAGAADEDAARRLRGRHPLRPHPLADRAGHAAHRRAARARLLPQGARPRLPGRAHPARLRALLPEPGGRRRTSSASWPRSPPRSSRTQEAYPGAEAGDMVGVGGVERDVRPLPARPRRRAAAARRRAGQPRGHGLRLAADRARRERAADARPRPPEGGRGGAEGGRSRARRSRATTRSSRPTAASIVALEPDERRDPRDGVVPDLQPEPAAGQDGRRGAREAQRPEGPRAASRRSSTAPSAAATRRARPTSR